MGTALRIIAEGIGVRYSFSMSESPDPGITSIFEAARLGWQIKLTCWKCGHVRILHAAALWLKMSMKGAPDDLKEVKRYAKCQPCRKERKVKIGAVLFAPIVESPDFIRLAIGWTRTGPRPADRGADDATERAGMEGGAEVAAAVRGGVLSRYSGHHIWRLSP